MSPASTETRRPRNADSRGADTRRRLIRAGLTLFGSRDFDNVTTRQIADTAGVNLAAIPYHFKTKENVYLAVAEQIVVDIQAQLGAAVERAGRLLENGVCDRDQLLDAIRAFVVALAGEILGGRDAALRAGFILREQLAPSAAFDILYDGFMDRAHRTLTALVASVLGRDPGDPQMLHRAQGYLGQVLGFRVCREVLLRRLDVRTLAAQSIADEIADNITGSLRRELETAQ